MCIADGWKWKPEKGSLDYYNQNHGMDTDAWERVKLKLLKLKVGSRGDSGIAMDLPNQNVVR